MNKLTQTFGNNAEVADGTEAQQLNAGAVRNLYPPECRECNGSGVTYGFGTNDPGEKEKERECTRCEGDGLEPEPEPEEEEE